MSHDLRTPLRAMAGFSQILDEDYANQLDDEGRDHLHRIRAAAVRLGSLIDGLLTFSRLARTELNVQEVDVSAAARRVVADLVALGAYPETQVVVQPDLVDRVDPVLFDVLLQNLFGNALKFSANVEHPHIEFGAEESEAGREYFMRDNGVGFDQEYAHRLFRPFERLHRDAEYPGTGIGLATVQRIVRCHGGEIAVEGAVGHGATVRFTLG